MRLPTPIAAVLALGLILGGCTAFSVIGPINDPAVGPDWATPLYELEVLAFLPEEEGQPLHVDGPGLPPHGLVIAPTSDRMIRGLHAGNGTLVWEVRTAGPNRARPVEVASAGEPGYEDILVASFDGTVRRLKKATGALVWKSEFPGKSAILEAPTVADGRIFVTSLDNRITALSLETGERLWDRRRPHVEDMTITGQAGALVVADTVITGFSDGRLVAYATADGATLWNQDLSGGTSEFVDVDTTPIQVGNLIVAGSYRVGLFGLDRTTGDIVWLVKGEGFRAPVKGDDGVLYVPQASGRILAVDGSNGRIRWMTRTKDDSPRTPALSKKYLLVPVGTSLLVLDRGTGRVHHRIDDRHGFAATPDVAWGTAYLPSNSGILYGIALY